MPEPHECGEACWDLACAYDGRTEQVLLESLLSSEFTQDMLDAYLSRRSPYFGRRIETVPVNQELL